MSASASRSGGDFLDKKSSVTKDRGSLRVPRDILIVEDESFDADRLKATLHLLFGYEVEIRRAATLGGALDAVIARRPEIVFLDDVLKPSDNASHTIPFLRHAGFAGPIIVISGQVTRQRRAALIEAGAIDVIHKDDVDSVRVSEALQRALGDEEASARRDNG